MPNYKTTVTLFTPFVRSICKILLLDAISYLYMEFDKILSKTKDSKGKSKKLLSKIFYRRLIRSSFNESMEFDDELRGFIKLLPKAEASQTNPIITKILQASIENALDVYRRWPTKINYIEKLLKHAASRDRFKQLFGKNFSTALYSYLKEKNIETATIFITKCFKFSRDKDIVGLCKMCIKSIAKLDPHAMDSIRNSGSLSREDRDTIDRELQVQTKRVRKKLVLTQKNHPNYFTREKPYKLLWKPIPKGAENLEFNTPEKNSETGKWSWYAKWNDPNSNNEVTTYLQEHFEENKKQNFANVRTFRKVIGKIRNKINLGLSSSDERIKRLSLMLKLIDIGFFRIGNKESEKEDVRGLAYLQIRHVKELTPDTFSLSYIAKKQIKDEITLNITKKVYKILKSLIKGKGKFDFLFTFEDGSQITEADVNKYLKNDLGAGKYKGSVHKFRHIATTEMFEEKLVNDVPKGFLRWRIEDKVNWYRQQLEKIREAIRHESITTTLNSYIDPKVVNDFNKKYGLEGLSMKSANPLAGIKKFLLKIEKEKGYVDAKDIERAKKLVELAKQGKKERDKKERISRKPKVKTKEYTPPPLPPVDESEEEEERRIMDDFYERQAKKGEEEYQRQLKELEDEFNDMYGDQDTGGEDTSDEEDFFETEPAKPKLKVKTREYKRPTKKTIDRIKNSKNAQKVVKNLKGKKRAVVKFKRNGEIKKHDVYEFNKEDLDSLIEDLKKLEGSVELEHKEVIVEAENRVLDKLKRLREEAAVEASLLRSQMKLDKETLVEIVANTDEVLITANDSGRTDGIESHIKDIVSAIEFPHTIAAKVKIKKPPFKLSKEDLKEAIRRMPDAALEDASDQVKNIRKMLRNLDSRNEKYSNMPDKLRPKVKEVKPKKRTPESELKKVSEKLVNRVAKRVEKQLKIKVKTKLKGAKNVLSGLKASLRDYNSLVPAVVEDNIDYIIPFGETSDHAVKLQWTPSEDQFAGELLIYLDKLNWMRAKFHKTKSKWIVDQDQTFGIPGKMIKSLQTSDTAIVNVIKRLIGVIQSELGELDDEMPALTQLAKDLKKYNPMVDKKDISLFIGASTLKPIVETLKETGWTYMLMPEILYKGRRETTTKVMMRKGNLYITLTERGTISTTVKITLSVS